MLLLRSNTLQSLESGQAHQHLVPMPGLLGEQSAHSDGETGQLQGHHVWCGAQAAFTGVQVRSPRPGEPQPSPEYRWVPSALGSHSPAAHVFSVQSPHLLNEPLRKWFCDF